MLNVRDHDVEDYTTLRDMDKTDVGVLSDDDRACLDEIGRYLVEAGAGERFALWLLHKHFEPNRGEVFVERSFTAPRRTETTLVVRADYQPEALHATAFRFDGSVPSAGVAVIGMEFAEADELGAVSPLSADDETVLAGVAELLAAHAKLDRFGLKLIRDPLDMLEHEVLFETNDSSLRTLYCDVSDRDAIPAASTITETSWRYRVVDGESEGVVMKECVSLCNRDVLEGHQSDHRHHNQDH